MGRSAATSPGADGSAPAGQASGTKVRTGRSVSAKAAASTEMSEPIGMGVVRACAGAVPRVVASTISPIGVMPAMGSVANDPRAYDTAPMRRPST
jgi:hypothetical protein